MAIRVARAGGRVVAGVAYEHYPRSGCGLVTYLVVAPSARRGGLGRHLLADAIATLHARGAPVVLGEVNDPRRDDGNKHEPSDVAWRRLDMFARWGARVVDARYVQPALAPELARDRGLALIALPGDTPLPAALDGAIVRAFVAELHEVTEARAPDAELRALLDAIPPVVALVTAGVGHIACADGDREPVRSVDETPRVTARDSAQRVGDALGDRRRLRKKKRPRRQGGGPRNRFEDPSLGLLSDTGRRPQPSLRCRRSKLVDRRDAERLPDLRQPAGADAQETAVGGQLRRDRPLELSQLGQLAGLDELRQPALDAGADAPQLSHAATADGSSAGVGSDRISSAARRYARVAYESASASSSSAAYSSSVAAIV